MALEQDGAVAYRASTAKAALRFVGHIRPHVVVVLGLPDAEAADLMTALQQRDPGVPVTCYQAAEHLQPDALVAAVRQGIRTGG